MIISSHTLSTPFFPFSYDSQWQCCIPKIFSVDDYMNNRFAHLDDLCNLPPDCGWDSVFCNLYMYVDESFPSNKRRVWLQNYLVEGNINSIHRFQPLINSYLNKAKEYIKTFLRCFLEVVVQREHLGTTGQILHAFLDSRFARIDRPVKIIIILWQKRFETKLNLLKHIDLTHTMTFIIKVEKEF